MESVALHPVQEIAMAVLAITAAVFDIRSRRIPNRLVLAGLVAGIGIHLWLDGWAGLKTAGIGLAVGFGVYFLLYLVRAMGAGDVKLMGALGAIAGWWHWFWVFCFSAVIGAVFALLLTVSRGRLRQTFWNIGFIVYSLIRFRAPYADREELDVRSEKALRMPHGLAIGLGVIAYLSARKIGLVN